MPDNPIVELFSDELFIKKIQVLLPQLFEIAQIESSRAGKTGMEVGNLREKILVSMLIHKFGKDNVDTEKPTTEPEVDVKISGHPLSIKTITKKYLGGIKISWTVDEAKSKEFLNTYIPTCDMLIARIEWNNMGGIYYIPQKVQKEYIEANGIETYLKLPKPGTNPRGIEITRTSLESLSTNENSKSLEIEWTKRDLNYDPYKRWVDYWNEDINET